MGERDDRDEFDALLDEVVDDDAAQAEATLRAARADRRLLPHVDKWRSLCLIEVPIDGDTEYGTGYLIARQYVLTAYHVLLHWNGKPIRIRFEGQGAQWRNLSGAAAGIASQPYWSKQVAWSGRDRGLDAALLTLDSVPAGFPVRSLVGWFPRSEERWESGGYFRAANPDPAEPRCAAALKGRMYNWLPLELSVDDPPASVDDDLAWAGASGAPIFHGDDIVAVFTGWKKRFAGRRLSAVPAFALLADPALCKLLGVEDLNDARWILELERRVAADLTENAEAKHALQVEFALAGTCEDMARRLLREVEAGVLALGINRADCALRDERKELERKKRSRGGHDAGIDAELLRIHAAIEIVRHIFAVTIPPRIATGLLGRGAGSLLRVREESGSGMPWVSVPTATDPVTEMLMAWVDRREARFRPHKNERKDAMGLHQVAIDGRAAPDRVEEYIRRVEEELCIMLSVDAADRRTLQMICRQLADRAREGEAFYLILADPSGGTADVAADAESQDFYRMVVKLQEHFSTEDRKSKERRYHLRVVVLRGDDFEGEYGDLVIPVNKLVKRWREDEA